MKKRKLNSKNPKYRTIAQTKAAEKPIDKQILIKEVKQNFDAEKGYIDYETVIQRISDKKFFKFTYTQFGYNGNDMKNQIAEEVFEKEKMTKYYE